ncbi:MAG: FHA domain-containing protein [Nanoarchaeota archaeon]
MKVGRNKECDIPTMNPKTPDPYTTKEKLAAGYVSGTHFYISHAKDGNVYLLDNNSINGLFIIPPGEEEPIRVHKKTRIIPGTRIFASMRYEFFLREDKIDIDALKNAEERASSDTTQILRTDELTRLIKSAES